jgi:hypothetical protein
MHAGEQHGPDEGPLSGRVGLTRGLVVIVTAVLVGGFLLYRGVGPGPDIAAGEGPTTTLSSEGSVDDETTGAVTGSTATASTAAGATATTGPAGAGDSLLDETTIAAAGTSPSDSGGTPATTGTTTSVTTSGAGTVTVLVLNAASEKGVAGKGTEILDEAGYTVMAPKNADALGPSQILYVRSDGQAQAGAVAEALGVDPAEVVEPYDPSAPPIASIGDADVVVIIGTDGVIDVSGG